MKNNTKKGIKRSALLLLLCILQADFSFAQMVGTNGYIKGLSVEIGIDGAGGFEGVDTTISPPLPGMHARSGSNYFGFVANPQLNAWAGSAFDGDFFTPGGPENGWGFEIGSSGGISGANNRANPIDIPGTLSWHHNYDCYTADWEGNYTTGSNINFKISYLLEETNLFYTTTISVKNNTTATIPEMYYYRNLDPDNNESISGNFSTTNTIVSEPTSGSCNLAHVSAVQTAPWTCYLGLAAIGANWRATYGGFTNRDGSDLWTGSGFTQTVGSSATVDEAISLAYKIVNLAPGATETFKFVTILDDASASNAINNLLYFSYPGSLTAPPSACTPYTDTARTCGAPVPIGIQGPIVGDYSWSWSPTTGLSPTSGPLVTANPAVTTTYTITGTPLTSCLSPVTMSVVVQVTPSTGANPIITPVPTVCTGSAPFNLVVDTTGGTFIGTGITDDSLGTFDPALAGPGTYTIIYYTNEICNNTATLDITVISSGSAIITQPPMVCAGTSPFTITAASTGGVWSGTGITDTTGGVFSPSVSGAGTFLVTYTIAGTCVATDTALVNIGSVTIPVTGISYVSSVCHADTADVHPVMQTGYTTGGVYSSTPGGLFMDSGTGIIDAVLSTPGTYTVHYHINSTICGPAGDSTASITIDPIILPVTAFSYITPVCASDSNMVPAHGGGFTTGGVYASTAGLSIDDSTGVVNVHSSVAGTYTITYTVNGVDSLCTGDGTDSTHVTINPLPHIGITSDQIIWIGNSTLLTVTGGSSYTWNATTPDLTCISASCDSATASPPDTKNYCVIVTDSVGCIDSACVRVSVEIPCPSNRSLTVPNAFTPNGDGFNDELCLYGWNDCVSKFQIYIYDRWGEKVFESTDPGFCWNGIYKGKLLDPAVFVYFIKATYESAGDTPLATKGVVEVNKKGNISIVH